MYVPPVTIMTLPERSGMSFSGSNDLPPKRPNILSDIRLVGSWYACVFWVSIELFVGFIEGWVGVKGCLIQELQMIFVGDRKLNLDLGTLKAFQATTRRCPITDVRMNILGIYDGMISVSLLQDTSVSTHSKVVKGIK